MANITIVPHKLEMKDVLPNFDFQLGIPVNEKAAEEQKKFLEMFVSTNFEVLNSMANKVPAEYLTWYLNGMKDMLAFVNLWIDSLNTLESSDSDITE